MSIYCSQRQYYVCNCQIKFTCLSGVFITKESMCGIKDHFRFVCRCFVILKRKWRQTYYFKSSFWRPYEFFHCLQPNLQSMAASVYSISFLVVFSTVGYKLMIKWDWDCVLVIHFHRRTVSDLNLPGDGGTVTC